MNSDNPHQDSRMALDEAARCAHAASLDHLSPRVQAQLAQRRRAVLSQDTRRAVRGWPMLAISSAAALTLVIGVFVMRNTGDAERPKTSDTAATAPAKNPTAVVDTTEDTATREIASKDSPDTFVDSIVLDGDALPDELLATEFDNADDAMGFDTLEENPDFYLWLGSEEAQADVMELL